MATKKQLCCTGQGQSQVKKKTDEEKMTDRKFELKFMLPNVLYPIWLLQQAAKNFFFRSFDDKKVSGRHMAEDIDQSRPKF